MPDDEVVAAASVFSVWRFPTDSGAQRAVHPLAWSDGDRLRIADAAVVSWPGDRQRPVVWQVSDLAGDRPFSGEFWGLLIGLLILVPLVELDDPPPPTTPCSSCVGFDAGLIRLGLDAAFAPAVRAGIGPGTSALFVLDTSPDPESLSRAMPKAGRQVARQVMTADQMAGLHAGFAG